MCEENKIINRQTQGWTDERHYRQMLTSLPLTFSKQGYKIHYSKYGKKENPTNKVKNKHEAGLQSHKTIHHYQPAKYDNSSLHSFTEYL